jgi:isocitrate/isopropylmalate dehydrogenase
MNLLSMNLPGTRHPRLFPRPQARKKMLPLEILQNARFHVSRKTQPEDAAQSLGDITRLPISLKIMIVSTNLFGDILSDEISGLVGGLGFAPGANIGEHAAMFEAVHGSAPDIAGIGIANPVSLLLAAGLMLEHVGRRELADRLRAAIDKPSRILELG